MLAPSITNRNGDGEGLHGLLIACVQLLFAFHYRDMIYECVLVEWYVCVADEPDDITGIQIVAPKEDQWGNQIHVVILLNTILQPAHLIAVYGEHVLPINFLFRTHLMHSRLTM